jgi:hypothetical protein
LHDGEGGDGGAGGEVYFEEERAVQGEEDNRDVGDCVALAELDLWEETVSTSRKGGKGERGVLVEAKDIQQREVQVLDP